MTREEFKKQRCEIDKITEEEFEKQYRVVKCDCGQPYCKGYRCLDLDGLLRDNQELREKLDKYENAVADYEKTRFEKEQLNSLVNSCQEEIRQLKKQLENKYEKVGTLTGELLYEENTKLINQQKEFIKYLEDEINKLKEQIKNYDIWHEAGTDINFLILKKQFYLEILQKYKEIIGGKDENK